MANHTNSDEADKAEVGGKIMIAQKQDKCTYLYLIDDHQYSVAQSMEVNNELENGKAEAENSSTTEENRNNFRWARPATRLLLELYNKKKYEFRDPDKKKKELWREISTIFNEKGYVVTASILDRKMRNLKSFYKSIKNNKRKTGQIKTSWEYFDMFEHIFGDDKSINSEETISSMPDTELEYLEECSEIFSPSVVQANSTSNNHVFKYEPRRLGSRTESANQLSSPTRCTSANSSLEDTKLVGIKKNRGLYALRKQQLKIEESRVSALNNIVTALERSNELQEQRNKLLEMYIKSKCLK